MAADKKNKPLIAKAFAGLTSGIITLRNYLRCGNDEQYHSFFCKTWILIPDSRVENKFKSREGWHLQGIKQDGSVGIICPGCEVLGFVASNKPGISKSVYEIS